MNLRAMAVYYSSISQSYRVPDMFSEDHNQAHAQTANTFISTNDKTRKSEVSHMTGTLYIYIYI